MVENRGNILITAGISDRNYNDALDAAAEGGVASLGPQNEKTLRRYFPDRGRNLGTVLVKLGAIRNALVQARGDEHREYNDKVRNQINSGRVADLCGGIANLVPFENFSIALAGNSSLLNRLAAALIEKLPVGKQAAATARWFGQKGVQTQDHGDDLNPEPPAYSRVVLGKWPIHLVTDEEGEVLVVTLIGNHRRSVDTYEEKMKSCQTLSAWFSRTLEERRRREEAEVEAEAQAAAAAAVGTGAETEASRIQRPVLSQLDRRATPRKETLVKLGFSPNETQVHRDSFAKFGPGGYVSYYRNLWEEDTGGWRRHRATDLRRDGDGYEDEVDDSSSNNAEGYHKVANGAHSDVAPPAEMDRFEAETVLRGELIMSPAACDGFADLSGPIAASEALRDRFNLDLHQADELALCIFWHTRSRAVYLMKCQNLLAHGGRWAAEFRKIADSKVAGRVGNYIMEGMVPSRYMGRIHTSLVRAKLGFLQWQRTDEHQSFTVQFVKEQRAKLRALYEAAERILDKTSTTDFLNDQLNKNPIRFVGKFTLPQVLPVGYMMALTKCHPRHAAQAPILDKRKAHYVKFLGMGVKEEYMDLSMMVVAIQHDTIPKTVENTGCEDYRKQENVHDLRLRGMVSFGMRPAGNATYRKPRFDVYMRPIEGGEWVLAVRDENNYGRWRIPERS